MTEKSDNAIFLEHQIIALENTVVRHESEINKIKDNYHEMDKNIIKIKNDVELVLDKLDQIVDNNKELDKRITSLETINENRNAFIKVISRTFTVFYKIRWPLILLFIMSFAVDIDFKIQNPQLLDYVINKLPPIFHKQ